MKKVIAAIALLYIVFSAYSQSCLPDGIIFETQAQIDKFQINYPGCSEIEGDVIIRGLEIENLNGLHVLNSIGGFLRIYETSLVNFSGLDNLTSIGGTLQLGYYDDWGFPLGNYLLNDCQGLGSLESIGSLFVQGNSLKNFTGLYSLEHIGSNIDIISNGGLEDFTGLENIGHVHGNLILGNCDHYGYGLSSNGNSTFNGLHNIEQIDGNLSICDTEVVNCEGLERLRHIGGKLTISLNDNMTSLHGLDSLEYIGSGLQMGFNDLYLGAPGGNKVLASIEALSNLNYLRGTLHIESNPNLPSLSGLDNIDPDKIVNLIIRDQAWPNIFGKLEHCHVKSICEYLNDPVHPANIYNFWCPSCRSRQQVLDSCQANQQCLDSLYLTTQSQVDSFQINYPGCTELEGNLIIQGDDITDLSGLNNLISIGGDLILGTGSTGPGAITNLSGLDSLQTIGGKFSATGCASLSSLTGLEGITELNGLYLENNPLKNLNGLENLTHIEGDVGIYDNDLLQNLEGLNELNSIAGNLSIGRLYPMSAPNGNQSLKSLAGINNLTSIGGSLEVMGNDSLLDFTGLNNLNSLGGSIDIFHNNSLISIEQLSNLTSINGRIKIGYDYSNQPYGNVSLVSLAGLDNIEYGTITEIDIAWNFSLTDCEANTICEYISNLTSGPVSIHDNAQGCRSLEEVQDSCEANFNINDLYIKDNLILYPNPAREELKISVEGFTIDELVIHTLAGQQVHAIRPESESIDISALKPGMYIIEVLVEGIKLRRKLLVE